MSNPYEIIGTSERRWVKHEGRHLGALSTNWLRSYVFPFFTPGGLNVLAESPPDHPHQQGIMVGQDLVNGHNFWAAGAAGFPINCQREHAFETKEAPDGVIFTATLQWHTGHRQAVVSEQRVTRFARVEDFHFVDVTSTFTALYGAVHFAVTKEGGVGMRVNTELETRFGGNIRSSAGATSATEAFDKKADWIEVYGTAGGRKIGIAMMPHPSEPSLPWFTRDYGLHLHGPRRHSALTLVQGESSATRVGFAAYDGDSQAARAWEYYRAQP